MTEIQQKYGHLCLTPSDINQLLPFLKDHAEKLDHITEMGTRGVVSTYAFLAGKPKKLVCYDIGKYDEVDNAERMAKEAGIEFEFHLKNVLEVDIEETDFLFIDTFHTATQLQQELALHADKVRKYIGFHDTTTFWERGEDHYEGIGGHLNCGRGLRYAIEPFLAANPEWKVCLKVEINNGLTIIERA